jgi:hypothetical protein
MVAVPGVFGTHLEPEGEPVGKAIEVVRAVDRFLATTLTA